MSREKYCLEIAEKAKEWLLKAVAEKTTRFDFKIVDTVDINKVATHKRNFITTCFHCTYKWVLNGHEKNVDTTIHVIYVPVEDSFHSDDPALF